MCAVQRVAIAPGKNGEGCSAMEMLMHVLKGLTNMKPKRALCYKALTAPLNKPQVRLDPCLGVGLDIAAWVSLGSRIQEASAAPL